MCGQSLKQDRLSQVEKDTYAQWSWEFVEDELIL